MPTVPWPRPEAADQRLAAGNAAPLTGIPLGIKDLMCTQGLRTTCASKISGKFHSAIRRHGDHATEKCRGRDRGQT
jgi:Asp-tRNA(Asn)/Glu-tRNA(Gln) amidotransferase A subunit family amidase